MLTASISVLDVAAKYKTDLLFNRYQAGRDVIEEHRRHPPFAYFIPREQRDPVAAVEMLRRLAFNGIEVMRLKSAATFEGQSYAAGTWVIPMNQPFANFVRQLFAVQAYPDLREYPEGPPDQPYDVAGWTLPYQMDVRVIAAQSPLPDALRQALEPVRGTPLSWDAATGDASSFDTPLGVGYDSHPVAVAITPPAGQMTGSGPALLIDAAQNNAFRALNRAWEEGASVSFVAGAPGGSGRFAITGLADAEALVRDLALRAERGNARGKRLARPRIGLYRPWKPSMDEGWTRWLLERYEFRFANVYNAEMVAGDLRSRFDVLLIVDVSAKDILEGHAKGKVPPRYAGGLGREGGRALDVFVRAGGTLVTLNRSSRFAIDELHLPVEDVVAGLERREFFVGGSIVEMIVDPSHPVMTGMPQRAKIFVARSPVFTVTDDFEGAVLAKYPASGSPLLSGYLLGEEHLQGYASALDVKHGEGRVVLLGARPQWRAQPFGTFRILFNALLYGSQLAASAPEHPGFWSPPAKKADEAAADGG